jgi:hypothetical protein
MPTGSRTVWLKNGPTQLAMVQSAGYIRLKPISQYMMAAMENNAMFLVICMVTFLDRTRPPSSMAKPAAMKKTRKPAMQNSRVVMI